MSGQVVVHSTEIVDQVTWTTPDLTPIAVLVNRGCRVDVTWTGAAAVVVADVVADVVIGQSLSRSGRLRPRRRISY